MEYVVNLLERHLKNEKSYKCTHTKLLKNGSVTDKRAYEMSIRLAQQRIPQLEKAINILKSGKR